MEWHWLDDLDGLVIEGDVIDGLAQMQDASADAIVTDPPYGLEFMNKGWDKDFLRQLVAYGSVDEETAERWKRRSRGNPSGAAFSKPGFGERDIGWPSFGERWQNRRCTKCGHLSSGGSPCKCPDPEWVVEGPQGLTTPLLAFQLWCELWARECLRVLKPGGHMVVFGAARTHHRMWCAVEDAGFEVRDMLLYLHGQGFPKSRNVSADIDRCTCDDRLQQEGGIWSVCSGCGKPIIPAGLGTGLKPAVEPILLARRPLAAQNVAANMLKFGTGALNIDACRIPTNVPRPWRKPIAETGKRNRQTLQTKSASSAPDTMKGRWPANVMLECACDDPQPVPEKARARRGEASQERRYDKEGATNLAAKPGTRREGGGAIHTDPNCPAALLDAQSGMTQSSGVINRFDDGAKPFDGGKGHPYTSVPGHRDFGGASRFFYCPKATKKERGAGNTHETVKPIALMRWLVRLVTPPGGVVVDPFCGSGSTLLACIKEGFGFVGIDVSEEYCHIALRRMKEREA